MAGRPLDRQRSPADDHQHDRRPGRDDALEQLLLAAHEPELQAIAELAGRRVVGQPRSLAEDDDRDVGGPCELDGLGDLGIGPVVDAGPPGVLDVGARQSGVDRVEDRATPGELVGRHDLVGQREAEGIAVVAHLEQRLDVEEVGVIPEQLAGAVGDRPDDRHAGDVRPERQDPVVLEQDERTARPARVRRPPPPRRAQPATRRMAG